MNVFNSLGSNYNFDFVLNSLFASGGKKDIEKLTSVLEDKYQGKVMLLYKGREAIETAVRLADLPAGSKIAVCGYTCYAVYKAIENAGFVTEYLDIDDGLNFSGKQLSEKIKKTPGIKAIIVQNTLGYPCAIKDIEKVAKENKLVLIEDLAHSAGASYKDGRAAGTVGDFVILSFSQDKIIDGISGGALIIRNKKFQKDIMLSAVVTRQEMIDKLYPFLTFLIRNLYGSGIGKIIHFILRKFNLLSKPMTYDDSGSVHALPGWYAAVIYREAEDLDKNIERRRKIAKVYADTLKKDILVKEVVDSISISSSLRFPILVERRDKLISFLKEKGIYISDIWYDAPVAPRKYMDKVKYNGSCKASEEVAEKMLNLPTHKNVGLNDAKKIAESINLWLQK